MPEVQTIIVVAVLLFAVFYMGILAWRKIRAFTARDSSTCATGCGSCASDKTPEIKAL